MTRQHTPLCRGWTTGACAAAAARAAYEALLTGHFPDPVAIRLPRGERPSFALALKESLAGRARAGSTWPRSRPMTSFQIRNAAG